MNILYVVQYTVQLVMSNIVIVKIVYKRFRNLI